MGRPSCIFGFWWPLTLMARGSAINLCPVVIPFPHLHLTPGPCLPLRRQCQTDCLASPSHPKVLTSASFKNHPRVLFRLQRPRGDLFGVPLLSLPQRVTQNYENTLDTMRIPRCIHAPTALGGLHPSLPRSYLLIPATPPAHSSTTCGKQNSASKASPSSLPEPGHAQCVAYHICCHILLKLVYSLEAGRQALISSKVPSSRPS